MNKAHYIFGSVFLCLFLLFVGIAMGRRFPFKPEKPEKCMERIIDLDYIHDVKCDPEYDSWKAQGHILLCICPNHKITDLNGVDL